MKIQGNISNRKAIDLVDKRASQQIFYISVDGTHVVLIIDVISRVLQGTDTTL